MTDDDEKFLIMDTRSGADGAILWWGPNRQGYTSNADEAGRYSREDAYKQHRSRSTDVPVAESLVLAKVQRRVFVSTIWTLPFENAAKEST